MKIWLTAHGEQCDAGAIAAKAARMLIMQIRPRIAAAVTFRTWMRFNAEWRTRKAHADDFKRLARLTVEDPNRQTSLIKPAM